MQNRTLVSVAAAAGLLTAFALSDAFAGNHPDPGAAVYNIKILLGQSFTFSSSHSAVTVDDVTYSMQLDMCALQPGCVVFTTEDIRGQEPSNLDQPPPLPPPAPPHLYVLTGGPGPVPYQIQRWGRGESADFGAELVDSGENAPPGWLGSFNVDAVSHAAEAELVARETWRWDKNRDYEESNGVGTGVGTSLAVTPTSESRHFQTSYRMHGATLSFSTITGGATYGGGFALVKGRLYTASDNPPPVTGP